MDQQPPKQRSYSALGRRLMRQPEPPPSGWADRDKDSPEGSVDMRWWAPHGKTRMAIEKAMASGTLSDDQKRIAQNVLNGLVPAKHPRGY